MLGSSGLFLPTESNGLIISVLGAITKFLQSSLPVHADHDPKGILAAAQITTVSLQNRPN